MLGAALATAAAIATILATAPLFAHQMTADNFQAAEFAQALQPIIGRFGASLFALGHGRSRHRRRYHHFRFVGLCLR